MYDDFSTLYDELVFDIDYASYAKRILPLLKGDRVLELGCGSGNFTKYLLMEKEVFAMDSSLKMLNMAWKKLGGSDGLVLSHQDLLSFSCPPCDSAVGLLDVFNYFLEEEDLLLVWKNISKHLHEDGIFVFDMNSRKRLLQDLAEKTWVYEKDGVFYSWETERSGDILDFYLNFFVQEESGLYRRVIEEQSQRYYPLDTIQALLKKAGFLLLKTQDLEGGPLTEQTNRVLFYCKKE